MLYILIFCLVFMKCELEISKDMIDNDTIMTSSLKFSYYLIILYQAFMQITNRDIQLLNFQKRTLNKL